MPIEGGVIAKGDRVLVLVPKQREMPVDDPDPNPEMVWVLGTVEVQTNPGARPAHAAFRVYLDDDSS